MCIDCSDQPRREQAAAYQRAYRQTHQEEAAAYQRAYRQTHQEPADSPKPSQKEGTDGA